MIPLSQAKREADDPRHVIPRPGCHDDVPEKTQRLHSSRHVALDVVTEARCSLPFQISEFYQEPGNDYGGNESNGDCGEKLVMPEKVEGNDASGPVGQEF